MFRKKLKLIIGATLATTSIVVIANNNTRTSEIQHASVTSNSNVVPSGDVATIVIDPKQYAIHSFPTQFSKYVKDTGEDTDIVLSVLNLINDPDSNVKISDGINTFFENSYLVDPFMNNIDELNNSVLLWYLANPLAKTADVDNPIFNDFYSMLSNLTPTQNEETFSNMEIEYLEHIDYLSSDWAVDKTIFPDIVDNIKTALIETVDNNDPNEFYLDFDYFRAAFEASFTKNVDIHDDVINIVTNTFNSRVAVSSAKLATFGFNYQNNINKLHLRVNPLKDDLDIFNDFLDANSGLHEYVSGLKTVDFGSIDSFPAEIIQELETELDGMAIGVVDSISKSIENTTSTNLEDLYETAFAEALLQNFLGLNFEIVLGPEINTEALVRLNILDNTRSILNFDGKDIFREYQIDVTSNVISTAKAIEALNPTLPNGFSSFEFLNLTGSTELMDVNDINTIFNQYIDKVHNHYVVPITGLEVETVWSYVPPAAGVPVGVASFTFKTFDSTGEERIVIKEVEIPHYKDSISDAENHIKQILSSAVVKELNIHKGIGAATGYIYTAQQFNEEFGINLTTLSDDYDDIIVEEVRLVYDQGNVYSSTIPIQIDLLNEKNFNTLSFDTQTNFEDVLTSTEIFVKQYETSSAYKLLLHNASKNGDNIRELIFEDVFRATSESDVYREYITYANPFNYELLNMDPEQIPTTNDEYTLTVNIGNHYNGETRVLNIADSLTSEFITPAHQYYYLLKASEFRDESTLREQLNAISDKDNPTPEEMDTIIKEFLNLYNIYTTYNSDGKDYSSTVQIGGIQNFGTSDANNQITITDHVNNDHEYVVTLIYDGDFVSEEEIEQAREEFQRIIDKSLYGISELLILEKIHENAFEQATEDFSILTELFDERIKLGIASADWKHDEYEEQGVIIGDGEYYTALFALLGVWNEHIREPGGRIDEVLQSLLDDNGGTLPTKINDSFETIVSGFSWLLNAADWDDTNGNIDYTDMDDLVQQIANFNKLLVVLEINVLDKVGRIVIVSAASVLSLVGMLIAYPSISTLVQGRKMKKSGNSVNYVKPKKLFSVQTIMALTTLGSAVALFVFVFVTKGGL